MIEPNASWQAALSPLLLLVPLVYAAGAVAAGRGAAAAWRTACLAGWTGLGLALATVAGFAAFGGGVARLPAPAGWEGALAVSVRLDLPGAVMLMLVAFIGQAILRYSRRYLDGEPYQARYVRWFLATLAAVTLLVAANNLLLVALAWIAAGLALHQLLTLHADRPQALIAAHKKFIASRVADLCLLGAVALIGTGTGTLQIDEVFARVAQAGAPSAAVQTAAVLLAIAAILKCAQLPFHGWLIQVMEAPTPVSALLHAGVVNIGGFLMIRLAPLVAPVEAAQVLLVAVGTVTAVVAALVTITRVSVKVALAWSTCAQMGFMLVECGLGAWSLALLHLVAHAVYKAHAFLGAGSTVAQWRARALAPAPAAPGVLAWIAAAVLALPVMAAVALLAGGPPGSGAANWVFGGVVALALAPVLARAWSGGGPALPLLGIALAAAVSYLAWHAVFGLLLPPPAGAPAPGALRVGLAAAGLLLLFLLTAVLAVRPQGRLARLLYPHLFAGLYLDELFTRLTFRVWPARLPERSRRGFAAFAPEEVRS